MAGGLYLPNQGANIMKTAFGLIFALAGGLFAQYPTYPGCANLKETDFKEVKLFSRADDATMDEPMRMDFYQDNQGNVNIYWVERAGRIKYYDAVAKTVKLVGRLDVLFALESGLLGIALDPNFKTNKWIYFYWSPKNPFVYRISRFTITPENTLDGNSEKVVLDIPDTRIGINVHNGGGLHFDKMGNLWVAIGEHDHTTEMPTDYHNTANKEISGEDESTDTYSLYGSVLRIHPEPDGSYTIPKGNFGEYWSEKFKQQGRNVLSAKYADRKLVRPEIYVKGFRDAMSVQVDPKTGWAVVSDCGAQCHKTAPSYYCPTHGKTEKTMLITEPSFQGWNYFHADNHPYVMNKSEEKNPLAPVNNSPFRLGVDTLPPAMPGTYLYGVPKTLLVNNWICSVGGYMYRYDATSQSAIKFPPHFDGKFFMKDLNQSFIRSIEVDAKGAFVKASEDLFTPILTKSHTLDMRQGPDGAMYLLNYATFQYTRDATTGLFRIEYTGNCKPTTQVAASRFDKAAIEFQGGMLQVSGKGRHLIAIYDVSGNRVYAKEGSGQAAYPLRLANGVYFLNSNLIGSSQKIVINAL
jgi:cytochrome c